MIFYFRTIFCAYALLELKELKELKEFNDY